MGLSKLLQMLRMLEKEHRKHSTHRKTPQRKPLHWIGKEYSSRRPQTSMIYAPYFTVMGSWRLKQRVAPPCLLLSHMNNLVSSSRSDLTKKIMIHFEKIYEKFSKFTRNYFALRKGLFFTGQMIRFVNHFGIFCFNQKLNRWLFKIVSPCIYSSEHLSFFLQF